MPFEKSDLRARSSLENVEEFDIFENKNVEEFDIFENKNVVEFDMLECEIEVKKEKKKEKSFTCSE